MKNFKYLVATALFFSASIASASVILHGTRIVYPSGQKDVTIVAENNGKVPALVQAWLDKGDEINSLDTDETPFVLTPPIFKLDPSKTQSIRVIYNKAPLPKDRESLFWLNVLEVPPNVTDAENQNALNVTFRNRIKVFFRPSELKGDLRKSAVEMQWSLVPIANMVNISIKNPTPFFITLTEVVATVGGKEYKASGQMVSPFNSLELPLSGLKSTSGLTKVKYTFIDEKGASVTVEAKP